MPRGVYDRKNAKARNMTSLSTPVIFETDEEIRTKLDERFECLTDMTSAACLGEVRSLIVSGPAGLGKSFTVEKVLEAYDPEEVRTTQVKGFVRATGLMRLLYQHRHSGSVIVFDDADAILYDEVGLNLIKAATDSSDKRMISWMTEAKFEDEDGDVIPRRFEFNGTVIFITNLDFDKMIDKGHKLAPHLEALISRAFYMDLAMKTKRDYFIRIQQVVDAGLLNNLGLSKTEQTDVMDFVDDHFDRLRETSLRMVLKIAALKKSNPSRFEKMARITCLRNAS